MQKKTMSNVNNTQRPTRTDVYVFMSLYYSVTTRKEVKNESKIPKQQHPWGEILVPGKIVITCSVD